MITFLRSAYFQSLLDGFSVGAVILNSRGTVYAANRAAAAILGYTRSEIMGPFFADKVRPRLEPGPEFLDRMARLLEGQPTDNPLRVSYDHPQRGRLELEVSNSLLYEADKLYGVLVELNDVTELIHLHQQEKQLLHEHSQHQSQRIAGLDKLAEGVAHQIRNPLTSMGGLARLMLKRKAPDDPDRRYLDDILEGCQRLDAIVQAMHQFTQPVETCLEPTDLAQVARRARQAREKAPPSSAPVRWTMDCPAAHLVTDPQWLGRALDQVLVNAWEALPANGGEITLCTGRDQDGAWIKVMDNGRGVAPDALPYVFDPFFTTKAVGVGMGLSLVLRIMHQLGGDARLEPRNGGGAAAMLRLPLDPPLRLSVPATEELNRMLS